MSTLLFTLWRYDHGGSNDILITLMAHDINDTRMTLAIASQEIDKEVSDMKLCVNSRARICAEEFLKRVSLAFEPYDH